jgi:hypothetical protein
MKRCLLECLLLRSLKAKEHKGKEPIVKALKCKQLRGLKKRAKR